MKRGLDWHGMPERNTEKGMTSLARNGIMMDFFMARKQQSASREPVGWKFPPSAWFPNIGLDHVLRGGKDLKDYVANVLPLQHAKPMRRKTGTVKKKKVNGKWVIDD
jgi:hypothetical protein